MDCPILRTAHGWNSMTGSVSHSTPDYYSTSFLYVERVQIQSPNLYANIRIVQNKLPVRSNRLILYADFNLIKGMQALSLCAMPDCVLFWIRPHPRLTARLKKCMVGYRYQNRLRAPGVVGKDACNTCNIWSFLPRNTPGSGS